jgi:hypothetical protein
VAPLARSSSSSSTSASSSSSSNCLEGVRVVLSPALSDSLLDELKEIVERLGGSVQRAWVPGGKSASTHLVCESTADPAYQHVDMLGGMVVFPCWLQHCDETTRTLPVRAYTVLADNVPPARAPKS